MNGAEQLAKAGLTLKQKQCLAMYCFDCKTMEQIGEILSIGKQRVHKHIKAAQAKLRKAGLPKARRLEHLWQPRMEHRDMNNIGPEEIADTL